MRSKKILQRLETSFGKVPDVPYFPGDMERIKSFYTLKADHTQTFSVDDTTWNDLSMDAVFQRLNGAYSTCGEHALYTMLRTPVVERDAYLERKKLLTVFESFPEIRQKTAVILFKLGKSRNARMQDASSPPVLYDKWVFLTALLTLLLFANICALIVNPAFALPALLLAVINPLYHVFMTHRLDTHLATVNYSVAMIAAGKRLWKLKAKPLEEQIAPCCKLYNKRIPSRC